MPKLRNGDSDVSKFTQWLGRKCRNHNPLAELKLPGAQRQRLPDRHRAKDKGDLLIVADGEANKLLYRAGERAFKITVEEIDADEIQGVAKIAVGF